MKKLFEFFKSKKGHKRGSSIRSVYIDRSNCSAYHVENGKIVSRDSEDSQDRYISIISTENIIKTTIEIDKNLSKELIVDTIYEMAYEDLSLDFDIDYIVRYIQRGLNYDDTKFEYDVYLISEEIIREEFAECKDTIPYIDFIIPSPFLYEVLYKKDLIPSFNNVDCFFYMGKSDSYLALYSQGQLLYYKTLTLSLVESNSFFNDFAPHTIDFEAFCAILSGSGDDSEFTDTLERLYNEAYLQIEEVISYTKRVYDIKGIDSLYLDSPIKLRDEIYKYIQNFLNIKCQNFSFLSIDRSENISPIYAIAIIYSDYYTKNGGCEVNYSLFHRPPAFSKRYSGKFINYTVAATLLMSLYPIYGFVNYLQYKSEIDDKTEQLKSVASNLAKMKEIIGELEAKRNSVLKIHQDNIDKSRHYMVLLGQVEKKKESYILKTKEIADIIKVVTLNGVNLEKFTLQDANKTLMTLDVSSNNDKKITSLIKDFGDNNRYATSPKEIKKEDGTYKTSIGVEVIR